MSITLPNEMAQIVRDKVASGEYASESEVIRDGLRSLVARDRALEEWLRTDVVHAYDELRANPKSGIPLREIRAALATQHQRAVRKKEGKSQIRSAK
jgi:putative addiction module CopG family antidote